MKRILIFTAGFGEGHNTAARYVRDALEFLAEDEAQVEIIDLFDSCYGRFNELMRKAYLTAINSTPRLWQGLYNLLDNTHIVETNLATLVRMQKAMEELLIEGQPDVVVSTYPIYNFLIEEIYKARPRHFSQITVVTDSISVNSIWFRTTSDYFIVPNDETGTVLQKAGIAPEKIKVFGFPVQLEFANPASLPALPDLARGEAPHILYLINSGKKKAPSVIEKLLEHKNWQLTIAVGRDEKLRQIAAEITSAESDRVRVLGWTNQMPKLMLSHHLIITKAGGATVQEAIAGKIPIIISQIVPGQEEGNYELIRRNNAGALAEKPKEIVSWAERAFENSGQLWQTWKRNITSISKPDSSIQIAQFLLDLAVPQNVPAEPSVLLHHETDRSPSFVETATAPASNSSFHPHSESARNERRLLLCDLHTHTTFSDGKLTISEMVDFYGQRGFDSLCITDHLCDPKRLLGKLVNLTGLVIPPGELNDYFAAIEKEKNRAWKKYDLILMTGVEFNKDGYTSKTSTHLLGIDLKEPINPSLDLKETIGEIHSQGALAVASHPHKMSSVWGKNTLYLWENQDEYAPLLDAWEIANRDDIFNPVGLKRLPFLANSDFHKPKHIHSWKTLLWCEKDPESIKECIRVNRDVSITLYRDHRFGYELDAAPDEVPIPDVFQFPDSSAA